MTYIIILLATTSIFGFHLTKVALALMNEAYYSEDEIYPRSPGLERVYPRAAPSPSPPPVLTKVHLPTVSSPSSRRLKKANRRKTKPTQGDWVLIREMAPNQPDIAHQVSQQALHSDTSDSDHDGEEEMEDQSPGTGATSTESSATDPVRSGTQPFNMQQSPMDLFTKPSQRTATSTHRDSVVEPDIKSGSFVSDRRASEVSLVSSLSNGMRLGTSITHAPKPGVLFSLPSAPSKSLASQRRDSSATPQSHEELSASLHQLQIPQSDNKLPIIQSHSPLSDVPSPNAQQQLPPISHMVGDLPRSASVSEEARTNGLAHRQSISSITHSPTLRARQMSISSHTPASPFPPLSASSPMSASSDMFLRSGSGHVLVDNRRPSQASEGGRFPPSLHSASTSDGYQSSDGPSPGAQQTPIENRQRHMSLDGAIASTIILPPPNGSNIQQMGAHVVGTFRCEAPGCTALPFQTQYLLK